MTANRKLIAGTRVAVGLLVGLIGSAASATDDIVVYGRRTSTAFGTERAVLDAAVAKNAAAFALELRTTLDRDLKIVPEPKIGVASAETRIRG